MLRQKLNLMTVKIVSEESYNGISSLHGMNDWSNYQAFQLRDTVFLTFLQSCVFRHVR